MPLPPRGIFRTSPGEMAEWSIAPVLKTGVPQGIGGSNPSLSAPSARRNAEHAGKVCAIGEKPYLCGRVSHRVRWMSGLVTGLQNQVRRFESATHLSHWQETPAGAVPAGVCCLWEPSGSTWRSPCLSAGDGRQGGGDALSAVSSCGGGNAAVRARLSCAGYAGR